MSTTLRVILSLLVCCCASITLAQDEPLAVAERQVEEYRALRKLCTVKRFEEKKQCFKELEQRTEQYQHAKLYLDRYNAPRQDLALD